MALDPIVQKYPPQALKSLYGLDCSYDHVRAVFQESALHTQVAILKDVYEYALTSRKIEGLFRFAAELLIQLPESECLAFMELVATDEVFKREMAQNHVLHQILPNPETLGLNKDAYDREKKLLELYPPKKQEAPIKETKVPPQIEKPKAIDTQKKEVTIVDTIAVQKKINASSNGSLVIHEMTIDITLREEISNNSEYIPNLVNLMGTLQDYDPHATFHLRIVCDSRKGIDTSDFFRTLYSGLISKYRGSRRINLADFTYPVGLHTGGWGRAIIEETGALKARLLLHLPKIYDPSGGLKLGRLLKKCETIFLYDKQEAIPMTAIMQCAFNEEPAPNVAPAAQTPSVLAQTQTQSPSPVDSMEGVELFTESVNHHADQNIMVNHTLKRTVVSGVTGHVLTGRILEIVIFADEILEQQSPSNALSAEYVKTLIKLCAMLRSIDNNSLIRVNLDMRGKWRKEQSEMCKAFLKYLFNEFFEKYAGGKFPENSFGINVFEFSCPKLNLAGAGMESISQISLLLSREKDSLVQRIRDEKGREGRDILQTFLDSCNLDPVTLGEWISTTEIMNMTPNAKR